ncbi:MAG TPA: acyl-CoA dehydrogenase family protein [Solirubrobacterales bacterium]|nr:acyl-CoA dehydrogenase family protein [Solirubrobacterales bacterium]
MDFGFSDEQQEIQRTAREFLTARFKREKVRELAESRTYDDSLWAEICELGWPGIAIDEAHGGQGLGMIELVILCEELGYACAPTPFLSNAAAGLLIDAVGGDAHRDEWLPGIASGEARGATAFTPDDPSVVPDAVDAAAIVLPEGDGVRVVRGSDAEIEPVDLIDSTRAYARVSADGGDSLPGDPAAGVNRIAVAVAAELTGVAQRAMEMAVEYAKEREQFGRPIGAYQAVSHRCARMLLDTEEARSLTYYAAWAADAEPESLPMTAAMAKARASDAAWEVTASALQVLGGIGFTWEHDLHFLLKRARVTGQLMGASGQYRERIADLVGLAAEPVAG